MRKRVAAYLVLAVMVASFLAALFEPVHAQSFQTSLWNESALGASLGEQVLPWVLVPGVDSQLMRELPGGCFEQLSAPAYLGGPVVCF